VVIADELSVYGTPNSESTVGFSLHEGAEIGVTETRGDWAHLSVPGHNLEGWAAVEGVMLI
jgi:hypothetical protein